MTGAVSKQLLKQARENCDSKVRGQTWDGGGRVCKPESYRRVYRDLKKQWKKAYMEARQLKQVN